MSVIPRILVIDGYVKAARDELEAGGAKKAGDQYVQMLTKINPNVHCDIIYPSDAGVAVPSGITLSDYDGDAWTGCSQTVFEYTPEVNTQIDFARACFDAGVPGFGRFLPVDLLVHSVVPSFPSRREDNEENF